MKKNPRDKGSIVRLLLQNHLLFTLSIALSALLIFYGATAQMKHLRYYPSIPLSTQDASLFETEAYPEIDANRVLMPGACFSVYNAEGQLLYLSNPELKSCLPTLDELKEIPTLDTNQYISVTPKTDSNGKQLLLLVRTTFLPDGEHQDEYMLLDDSYRVLEHFWEGAKEQYTPREYAFLTHTFSPDYELYRYTFETTDGETRAAAIFLPLVPDAIVNHSYQIQHRATALFVLIYILLALLFVLWLNRTVRKPLLLFSQMIEDFSLNKPLLHYYAGQREFVRIFDSFSSMAEQLRASQAQKAALEAERQVLLANISHDLKTPVTVIQGYAKAICDDLVAADDKKRYDQIIYQKSCTLSDLINTFAEYSRLEHPEFKLDLIPCDIYETMREYLVLKYDEIDISGYGLDLSILEDRRCICLIDRQQLARVFDNLIANTMKYNPPGTILSFSVDHGTEKAIIRYADDGIGISDELAKTIFDPFVVGQKARTGVRGSGLGLAITKKIITAHHGSIALVQPPRSGKGLEFEVKLPIRALSGRHTLNK